MKSKVKVLLSIASAALAVPLLLSQPAPQLAQDAASPAPNGMALIPAGEFWMGRTYFFFWDRAGIFLRPRRDDLPARKVYVDAFYMDKYEVTAEEYARFVEATNGPKVWYWPEGVVPKNEWRLPVHDVNWNEADTYCRSVGKRLPTEAEWEKAARGGLDKQKFPWGNQDPYMPDYRGSEENANNKLAHVNYPWGPVAVGSYPPNGYGLYDMTGNVWEWTNDWYRRDYYTIAPDRNPPGPATGEHKVIRGAGWSDRDMLNVMVHYRNYADPVTRTYTIGFRCAQSVGPQ